MQISIRYFTISFFLFITSFAYPQTITKFTGVAAPGNVIVGYAENIKSILFEKKKINFDPDGYFIIGFDRDAKGAYQLKITFKDKRTEVFDYNIDPEKFETQRINGLQKKLVLPPKKERLRIARESQIISTDKKNTFSENNAFYKTGFITPVDSAEITGWFGSGRILNGIKKSPHNGIDYSTEEGKPVKAAGDGVVLVARTNFYYNGTFIMIDHGGGLITIYLHLSKLHVKRGDKVSKGDLIGEVGSTGRSTGSHLHFGVQLFNKRIDPLCLFQLGIPAPMSGLPE